MTNTSTVGFARLPVAALALLKLAIHLYAGRYYGYFVDELYYLACSRHLAWGYPDQPPLIAAAAWMVRHILGDSLPAIRLLPALAGAALVVLTAALAWQLGGGVFAQSLAALAVVVAPGFLAMNSLFTMNAFEPLFWMGCAWCVVRMVKTGRRKPWIWFGVLAGLGLENKHSMLIFGAGVVVGLLLTPERRLLASRRLWAGGAIAALIFLPNLLWNINHHFPFLEIEANIRQSGRDVRLSPLAFFGQEALLMLPLSLPVWLAGLWFYFFTEAGKRFRSLGWAWVFAAVVIVALSPRIYYLWPAFPLLFAAGGVAWETWLSRPGFTWVKVAYPALMLASGILLAPLAIPVLPPETYIRYTQTIHLGQPRIETHKLGPLPQIFADQFGWQEMAATVAGVYNSLPVDVRRRTAIFGQTYGQAGAIDFFGPRYGLPPAISGHQSYFLWGDRGYSGDSMIVMDDRKERLERLFTRVEKVARVEHPYSMPYNRFDVYYCQGIKQPLGELWPKLKRWE
jgi:4-amino-4-deoxy-L-arabinose transferase-like glycosyltransferase